MTSILVGIGVGVVGEIGAFAQGLWVYRRPLYPVVNVLVMFGLVMGTLARVGAGLGVTGLFGLGFAVGLAYEAANFALLDWWYFPDDRFLGLRGRMACAVGVSLGWGTVPVLVAWLVRA
jgi:hypothetical protein